MTSAATKYYAGTLEKKKATFKTFGRLGQRSKVKIVARDGGVGEKEGKQFGADQQCCSAASSRPV